MMMMVGRVSSLKATSRHYFIINKMVKKIRLSKIFEEEKIEKEKVIFCCLVFNTNGSKYVSH